MATQSDVFWVGQDGNVYAKGVQGVQNYGSAKDYTISSNGFAPNANSTNNAMAQAIGNGPGIYQASQIQDPATVAPAPTNPTGATTPALDTGAVNATGIAINQIAPLLAAALGSENTNYGNTVAGLDAQQKQQQDTYNASTTTNQQNYDSNFMAAIRAGIQGVSGLINLLRGTGAAGGTAEDQAKNIVGSSVDSDVQSGEQTQKTNQGALDSSLSQFLTTLAGTRATDADTHANNQRSIQQQSDTQLQDLYSKMAGYYGTAGDTANANSWEAKAASLTPGIAANTETQVTPYNATPIAVTAPQLTAFAAPTQPSVVTAPNNSQIGAGIFTLGNSKKDSNSTPATATTTTPAVAGV